MVVIKRDAAAAANGIKLMGRKPELPARLPRRAYEKKIRKDYAVGLTAGFQHPPIKRGVVRDKMRNALQKRRHLRPKFQKREAALHILPHDAVSPCEQDTPSRGAD